MTLGDEKAPVERTRTALLVAGTALVVATIWRVSTVQRATTPGLLEHPGLESRPAAPRPPRTIRLDFGSATARPALAAGFGPDERGEARTFVRLEGDRSLLVLSLAPDSAGMRLTLRARVEAGAATVVGVRVNGVDVGSLDTGSSWSQSSLDVAEELLLSGRNEFELSARAPVLLDRLDVTPVSASVEFNPSSPVAGQALLDGFTVQPEAGRLLTRLSSTTGHLRFRLHPLPTDYLVGVSGRAFAEPTRAARVHLAVNDAAVGSIELLGRGGSGIVQVSADRLRAGDNRIELSQNPGPQAIIERLVIEPVLDHALIDVGSPAARPHLISGFSTDEALPYGSGAWSEGMSSRIALFLAPTHTPYRLAFAAHAFPPVAPLTVIVTLNGQALGQVVVGASLGVHELTFPRNQLRGGQNLLELAYARTAQPRASIPGSTDARELAVRYDWLELSGAEDPR